MSKQDEQTRLLPATPPMAPAAPVAIGSGSRTNTPPMAGAGGGGSHTSLHRHHHAGGGGGGGSVPHHGGGTMWQAVRHRVANVAEVEGEGGRSPTTPVEASPQSGVSPSTGGTGGTGGSGSGGSKNVHGRKAQFPEVPTTSAGNSAAALAATAGGAAAPAATGTVSGYKSIEEGVEPSSPDEEDEASPQGAVDDAMLMFNRATSMTVQEFAKSSCASEGVLAAGEPVNTEELPESSPALARADGSGALAKYDRRHSGMSERTVASAAGGGTSGAEPLPHGGPLLGFLAFVMLWAVGSWTEGFQTYSQQLGDRGVYFDECTNSLPANWSAIENITTQTCAKQMHKLGQICDIGLSVMNLVGLFTGVMVDSIGVKAAAIGGALLWGVATSIGGISPADGVAWSASFAMQSCFSGVLFLCIFTGLLRQICPDDRSFSIWSCVLSACWDAGSIGGYLVRFWLQITGLSVGALYAIMGGACGLFMAVVFQAGFRPPDRPTASCDAIKNQAKSALLIIKRPIFWMCTACFTMVATNGYFILGFVGEILEWRGANAAEIREMRPWIGNAIAFSAPFALVPSRLMTLQSLGIFGGIAATCVLTAVMSGGILAVLLFGGVQMQYVMFGLVATWRTITFTLLNAGLPIIFNAPETISSVGFAFGVMMLVAGIVSFFSAIFLGKALEGDHSSHLARMHASNASGIYNHSGHTHSNDDVELGGIAGNSTFVWIMCMLWILSTVMPLLLAFRCYSLQLEVNEEKKHEHHHHHKHHHHHEHSKHSLADGGDGDEEDRNEILKKSDRHLQED